MSDREGTGSGDRRRCETGLGLASKPQFLPLQSGMIMTFSLDYCSQDLVLRPWLQCPSSWAPQLEVTWLWLPDLAAVGGALPPHSQAQFPRL